MDYTASAKPVRSSRAFIVGALSLCLLTYTMLYGFLLPVLPTVLVERMSVSTSDVQRWISLLLSLEAGATLLFSPLVGYLVILLRSRRLCLLAGLILLGAATAIIATSRSISMVVTGRIVQGISSAVIQVVCNALILDCSPDDAVGQYLGYAGAATNLGFLAGPLLGGVLFQYLHWDGLFGIVGGVILVNLFVPLAALPVKQGQRHQNTADPSTETSTALQTTERKTAFTKLKLLMVTKMYIELWASFVTGIFISAIDTVMALFVKDRFDWDSMGQGLIFLPISVPALFEPVYGWFADKCGPRITGFIGFSALVPATVSLRFVSSNSLGSKALLCTLLGCIGVFLDATDPAGYLLVNAVLKDSRCKLGSTYDWKDMAPRAFGIQNAAQYFGIMVGPFIILAFPAPDRLASLGLLLGCLSALTAVLWIWGVGGHDAQEEQQELTSQGQVRTAVVGTA